MGHTKKKTSEIIEVDAADAAEVVARPYTLRKLKDGDLIPLLGLFRKLGLKDFKSVMMTVVDGRDVQEVGVSVLLNLSEVVIANLESAAGEAVYQFYSSLSGIPVEEMKEMEFGTLPLMVYDSFNEVKNTSFFRVLAKLL